ncbi:MAG: cysteine--tRNA ligase [Fimbriimonadaceae bacterium]
MSAKEFKLYDSLSRQVKPIATAEPNHLRMYSCGPTVYAYAHIGNFRTFIVSDLISRTAQSIGWRVTSVSNITDVGHLTEDNVADASGEDKMAKGLKSKEGEGFANVWDLARYYADAFEEDWANLNLQTPTVRPRATEHMREQIVAVEDLISKGNAYETPTGVYFDVESFADYGKLSGNRDREELQVAVREVVQDDNKKNPADFALWKKDDKHLMQWFSPWGWGFPGWHIECSVMAQKYLGDTIDLHGGGEDLRFPHHECEIAQSEAGSGKPFCNHWFHVTFLQVEGEKMSKSKGNFFTARDILEQGFSPLALRLALISVPYNKPHNFTLQTLRDSQNHVERFQESLARIAAHGINPENFDHPTPDERLKAIYLEAQAAMLNDLNTSVAVAKALEGNKLILRDPLTPITAPQAALFLKKTNDLLGIIYNTQATTLHEEDEAEPIIAGHPISELIIQRAEAKASKDFATADKIRNDVETAGFELRDSPEGTTWRKLV